jgi:hypothetical protein
MDENEYLHQYLIKERLREAQARGILWAMLRETRPVETPRVDGWSRRLGRWWRRRRGASIPFSSQADGSVLG